MAVLCCLSVCVHDYSKTSQCICVKFMVGRVLQKEEVNKILQVKQS